MRFEFIVAFRYLRAKRKQAVVSLITVISVLGVTAGVAALVIALAMNRGFTQDLQEKLLGARPPVTLLPPVGSPGIPDYLPLIRRIGAIDGVVSASPAYYVTVLLDNDYESRGVYLKGIVPELEMRRAAFRDSIVEGSVDDFSGQTILLGRETLRSIGALVGERVHLTSGKLSFGPTGGTPRDDVVTIVGAFESGFYEFDTLWAFVPIRIAQRLDGTGGQDVASAIEVEIEDLDQSDVLAPRLAETFGLDYVEWKTQNAPIFQALKLERLVMFITIGLIVIVASLNIIVTLVMMVMEKVRDIAVLISMGARRDSIRRIFVIQGLVIGIVGTALGLTIGNTAAYFADAWRLVSLPQDVYSINYVPFDLSVADSLIVGGGAILISYLATIYPSRRASGLEPVEAFRYE
jgi:lipoprotein-releasing system permease protein